MTTGAQPTNLVISQLHPMRFDDRGEDREGDPPQYSHIFVSFSKKERPGRLVITFPGALRFPPR